MGEVVLKVEMKCEECVQAVREKLEKLDGVESVDVSLEKQQAVVRGAVSEATAAQSVAAWTCVTSKG